MNKPTLWQRFKNWLSSIINRSSTKKPEIVNHIVNQETECTYDAKKYMASINSLYKHKSFTPTAQKDITQIYDAAWQGKQKFDYRKTEYKFERPSFVERVRNRFGR